eukprot:910343-Amphidinium_carterae.1
MLQHELGGQRHVSKLFQLPSLWIQSSTGELAPCRCTRRCGSPVRRHYTDAEPGCHRCTACCAGCYSCTISSPRHYSGASTAIARGLEVDTDKQPTPPPVDPGCAVSEVSATSCNTDDSELHTYPSKLIALTVQGLREERQHIENAITALQAIPGMEKARRALSAKLG